MMTQTEDPRTWIRAFGDRYEYGVDYLLELHEHHPEAFELYQAVEPMAIFRKELPLDAHFVARVAAMQSEDCGPCTQLTLRLAVEAGVERDLLRMAVEDPSELPGPLLDVRDHAFEVVAGGPVDTERAARLREHFGEAGFLELALVITGSRLYPAMRRAMLHGEECIAGALRY